MMYIVCFVIPILMTSLAMKYDDTERDKELMTRQSVGDDVLRKSIQHKHTYHRPPTAPQACRFKRCHIGEKCVVDGLSGRGTCVCKRHCRQVVKPVCGTDGEYYTNRCEMHKTSCLSGKEIFDAKHKDCFYKRSDCNISELSQFRRLLLEYHHSITSMSRHGHVINDLTPASRDEVASQPVGGNFTAVITNTTASSSREKLTSNVIQATSSSELYEDVVTNDFMGDSVKRLFRFFDLDQDELVGSEELYEVTLMEGLDSVLPPPCSLFHLLHFADVNSDNAIDVFEIMKIYNVTLLHLPVGKEIVRRRAVAGLSLTLLCEIEGERNPTWWRGNFDLSRIKDVAQIDGAAIHFMSAHQNLAGNFTCRARDHPNLFQTIELSILTKPSVQIYPKTQRVFEQSSATVVCRAMGIPPPHVTWKKNGKVLDRQGVLLLENNTELHINSARTTDNAAYTCLATNEVGTSENIAAVIVDNPSDSRRRDVGAFYIFHEAGITIVESDSCQTLRLIDSEETMPGLLRQDKLCKVGPDGENRLCRWSQAVSVGSRFVYAAQPLESRLIVLEVDLQRVVEVLATSPLPYSLDYVTSNDQLFVLCWMDWSREHSMLLVVHAAAVPGVHMAAQIQPLDGGRTIDLSVFTFFVSHETWGHGFVAHRRQQSIYKLDLATLVYDDVIDLTELNCFPIKFGFQPIGGVLDVTCQGEFRLKVDTFTGSVMTSEFQFSRQFVSEDARYLLRSYPNGDITMHRIRESGTYDEIMNWKTNLSVCDVTFVPKLSDPDRVIAYLSSQNEDFVMYVDPDLDEVQKVRGTDQSDCPQLVPSAWYDRYLATSSYNHVNVINLNNNQITCHINDVTNATTIVWADGEL